MSQTPKSSWEDDHYKTILYDDPEWTRYAKSFDRATQTFQFEKPVLKLVQGPDIGDIVENPYKKKAKYEQHHEHLPASAVANPYVNTHGPPPPDQTYMPQSQSTLQRTFGSVPNPYTDADYRPPPQPERYDSALMYNRIPPKTTVVDRMRNLSMVQPPNLNPLQNMGRPDPLLDDQLRGRALANTSSSSQAVGQSRVDPSPLRSRGTIQPFHKWYYSVEGARIWRRDHRTTNLPNDVVESGLFRMYFGNEDKVEIPRGDIGNPLPAIDHIGVRTSVDPSPVRSSGTIQHFHKWYYSVEYARKWRNNNHTNSLPNDAVESGVPMSYLGYQWRIEIPDGDVGKPLPAIDQNGYSPGPPPKLSSEFPARIISEPSTGQKRARHSESNSRPATPGSAGPREEESTERRRRTYGEESSRSSSRRGESRSGEKQEKSKQRKPKQDTSKQGKPKQGKPAKPSGSKRGRRS